MRVCRWALQLHWLVDGNCPAWVQSTRSAGTLLRLRRLCSAQDIRTALAMLLLGRVAGDTAEFHRLGGETGLAGLVYDSDPRIRSVWTFASDSAHTHSRRLQTSVRLGSVTWPSCTLPAPSSPAQCMKQRVSFVQLREAENFTTATVTTGCTCRPSCCGTLRSAAAWSTCVRCRCFTCNEKSPYFVSSFQNLFKLLCLVLLHSDSVTVPANIVVTHTGGPNAHSTERLSPMLTDLIRQQIT
jgi:hypothetical protein